ncbi:MAG TPA: hypothetical protein VN731_09250 [Rhodanobacter sp.]|nr:hypothetical protein [Rhodanobacter sp.]
MDQHEETGTTIVPCCPSLAPCAVCDVLNFTYRLPFRPVVAVGDRRQIVPVEVTLHFRLTRCAGPLSLGDVIYTTTLLPGEQVKLASSDRHTRFSFDSETHLSYRNEATSEESYYAAGMAYGMSNLDVLDTSKASSSFSSSSVSGGGGAGIDLGFVSIGGSAAASSHDANSTSSLAHSLSSHAQSLQQHMEVSTRAAASTSVGEVATRSHQQGESEDQYESATRTFSNPNHCHAIAFYFYRLNKCQTVKFELVGIERRVDDPLAPTSVALNPPVPATGVAVRPAAVLATGANRLDVARRALDSVAVESAGAGTPAAAPFSRSLANFAQTAPIPVDMRRAALQLVDQDLLHEGLLDKVGGTVSPAAQKALGWEREMTIPTPGVLVKGCLDACDICEPELQQQIALDLVHRDLENQLLKKQIDLLEKSQEYRCCPAAASDDD